MEVLEVVSTEVEAVQEYLVDTDLDLALDLMAGLQNLQLCESNRRPHSRPFLKIQAVEPIVTRRKLRTRISLRVKLQIPPHLIPLCLQLSNRAPPRTEVLEPHCPQVMFHQIPLALLSRLFLCLPLTDEVTLTGDLSAPLVADGTDDPRISRTSLPDSADLSKSERMQPVSTEAVELLKS